ncbi:hypothetical protein GUITHDRAFT_131789 [Guillardia theta CCMP2712]|uniref:Uncharacterized protein n=2 Tax=Guillardia theta TaxID=55529 RepID=L1K360_GUITC|nr:hypothetical protein GUITHDRAFT_131789 [Guillardia theta CCMP2712]EKX54778.1 hypothetical protein GUITHDRAFT_131789 [Guillardia theta CCMP2712]|eukprot:XP_005841758.1 hypothetical protein GUITHDRAFT_131789 [Guillardia theta CCMP2712]
MQGDAAGGRDEAMGEEAEATGVEKCRRQYVSMMDEGKSLEEITLKMLDELGSTVKPARYVPNVEAIQWTISQLQSASPPQELDMEWFSVGDAESTQIAQVLMTNTSVTRMKLRYNEIRDEGAKALASCIASHPTLQSVHLGNNIIGNEGADALARAIAQNGRIKKLDLRYNNMGPALPQSFTSLTCLESLDIRANRLVSLPSGLGELTALQELVVERNHDLMPKNLSVLSSTPELLEAIRRQDESGTGP